MIRVVSKLSATLAILAGLSGLVAFAPTPVWANSPGDSPEIVSGTDALGNPPDGGWEEASRLIVVADFNGDGIADIAKATFPAGDHSGPGILTVSLGNADGSVKRTFSKPVLGHDPSSIVAIDSNRDGIPDLIVGDDDGSLILFLGDGKGSVTAAGTIAHLGSVASIVVGDFNHDGISDLAVSDWRSGTVVLLLGAGDGSFARGRSFPLPMPGGVPKLGPAGLRAVRAGASSLPTKLSIRSRHSS